MIRAVQPITPHKHVGRGDDMEKKYAATYQLGNATVHINDSMISDDPDVQAEIDSEIATAAWAIIEEIIARGEEL